jgi:hypothetical protein
MSSVEELNRGVKHRAARSRLRLVPPSARTESTWDDGAGETVELKLSFRELVLISRALAAVKTCHFVAGEDMLLNETIHVVDMALKEAI